MTYYQKVLQPGEAVRYSGHLHWLINAGSWTFAVTGVYAILAASVPNYPDLPPVRITCGIVALDFFGVAWAGRSPRSLPRLRCGHHRKPHAYLSI